MSNPVKLRCLDDSSQNMFIVSVNTRASINASTGALVLHNGGLSINSTENALNSFVGGALTVGGGAAFAKDLKVQGGMTIGNINLTGDLFQNGELYASSQWVSSTNGTISYTSGSVETTNLNITNFTVANFNGINFTAENLIVDTLNLGMSNIFSGSFNASNNLQVPTNIEGFVLGSNITAFQCNLIVSIVSSSNLYENFNLSGNKSSTGWNLYVSSIGDTSGINFFITTNGQLQYTSSNVSGFVSCTFRYVVTQINETGRYTEFQPSSSGSYIFDTLQISGTQQATSGIQTGSFLVDGGATISKNLVVNGSLISNNNSNTVGSLISTGGNIGVGTNSPNSKLHLSSNTSTNLIISGYTTNTSGGVGILFQNDDQITLPPRYKTQILAVGNGFWGQSNLHFLLNNVNNTQSASLSDTRMVILNNGNIGIGTTNPGFKLHIEDLSNNPNIRVQKSGSNQILDIGTEVSGLQRHFIFGYDQCPLILGTNAIERLRIDSVGNVGVGTTSPNSLLHVNGSFIASGTINTIGSITTNGANVGIGYVTTPLSRLHVAGGGRFEDMLLITQGFSSSSGLNVHVRDPGYIGSCIYMNSTRGSSSSFSYINANANGVSQFLVRGDGSVGIGTSTPGARLDVRGNMYVGNNTQSNFIAFFGTNNDSPGSYNHTYIGERIYTGNEASELLLFKGNDLNAAAGNIDRIRLLSSEHYFDTYTSEASGTFEAIAATGTTRMVIRNNGNVGIGTTAPNAKLDIVGTGNGWGLAVSYSSSDMGGSYWSWPLTYMNSGGVVTANYVLDYSQYTGRIPSVYNANGYVGTAYLAFSDRRIKENIEEINDTNALELLRQIQPSTYNYVDKLKRSTKKVYGFIAQQVKEVLPESIEFITEYLPTIYKKGTITNSSGQLILKLLEAPTFPFSPLVDKTNTSGNTIYCYTSSGQPATDNLGNQHFQLKVYDKENKEFIVKIQEIIDETTFVLNSSESTYNSNETEYFVYGQLANDYHSLDKNYVFTVATAALQEVDRQLQTEKQAHQETKQRLESLETFLKLKFPGEL